MNDTATPAPAPPSPSSELRAALSEAGLRAGVADTEAGSLVRITPLDPVDAQQLARLIRTGTKRALKAARTLREICAGYRIDLPGLRVRQGRITLGPIQVDDAARLARLLNAVPCGHRTTGLWCRTRRRHRKDHADPGFPAVHRRRRPLRIRTGAHPGPPGPGLDRRQDRSTPDPRLAVLNRHAQAAPAAQLHLQEGDLSVEGGSFPSSVNWFMKTTRC